MTNAFKVIRDIVVEVATLQRPVTAAAVAGLLVTIIPGVNITATAIAGVLVTVGGIAAVLEKYLPSGSSPVIKPSGSGTV